MATWLLDCWKSVLWLQYAFLASALLDYSVNGIYSTSLYSFETPITAFELANLESLDSENDSLAKSGEDASVVIWRILFKALRHDDGQISLVRPVGTANCQWNKEQSHASHRYARKQFLSEQGCPVAQIRCRMPSIWVGKGMGGTGFSTKVPQSS